MVERRFARTLASLDAIFQFIHEFAAAQGVAREAMFELDLIAEELFTNMIKYAPGGTQEVAIGLDWDAPNMRIRLCDFDVESFDPNRAPGVDTSQPLEQRRAGGLGLHLVRQIADRIDYAYQDRTSTITVIKRVAP